MLLTIVLLLILSPILFYVATIINKYIKLPILLVYIFIGLVFQIIGVNNIKEFPESVDVYTQAISITMIYIMAGQVFNVKNQEKITIELGMIPVTITIGLNFIFIYGLKMIIFPTYELSPWILLSVLAIASASTPVLFLVYYNKLPREQMADKKIIKILNGAIFDQIPSMIYILVPITIGIGFLNGNGDLTNTIIQLVIQIAVLFFGIFIGYIGGKIILNLFIEQFNLKIITILLVTTSILLVQIIPILTAQYLLVAVGIGLAINTCNNQKSNDLKQKINIISNYYAFPIMFFSLGLTITIRELFNWQIIIITLLVFVFIVILKAIIVRFILIKNHFSSQQVQVGIIFTLLTGATYINMAISFKPYFITLGYPELSVTLSVVGIILYIFSILMLPMYKKTENNIINKIFKISNNRK